MVNIQISEIRGKGLLIGIEIVEDKSSLTPFDEVKKITSQLMQKGLEEGVFLYPGGTEDTEILFDWTSFYYSRRRSDLIVSVVKDSIEYVTSRN